MPERVSEKEAAVYAAVIELLKEGVSALTVSDIAARAGIGKGTVYGYFDTKEQIIERSITYTTNAWFDSLMSALRDEHDLRGKLDALWEKLCELRAVGPTLVKAFLQGGIAPCKNANGVLDKAIGEVANEILESGKEVFAEGTTARQVAFTVSAFALAVLFSKEADTDREKLKQTATAQTLRALRPCDA